MSMPLPLELTKPVLLTGITVDGVDAVVDDNDVL